MIWLDQFSTEWYRSQPPTLLQPAVWLGQWILEGGTSPDASWPVWVFAQVAVIYGPPAAAMGTVSPVVAALALSRSRRTGITVGNVYAWGTLGSIIGTFLVVPYQGSPRLGWIMLAGLGATAFSLQGFALVTGALATGPFGLGLALTATCAMGLFSTVYLISSMTVMQLNVPEQLRGRVMGLHGITYSLIPLGGLLAGFLAEVWSAPVADRFVWASHLLRAWP